jgi:transposase
MEFLSEQSRQRRSLYPAEMRERAVRLVFEAEQHCETQWEVIRSVADELGPNAERIRLWVRRAEVDAGRRGRFTTDERQRLKNLERENRDLHRANEILKSGSVFFATELDGRTKR